jgi:dihydropteroate synthase
VAQPSLTSSAALALNPLVTGWDDAWRPMRVDLADGTTLALPLQSGLPDETAAAVHATLDAFTQREHRVPCPTGALECGGKTLVMGIVNVTPDSFSDGGQWLDKDAAVRHGLELVEHGADILDVGGESTRPGSDPVTPEEERRRTEPVVAELAARCGVPISIDTMKAEVARAALDAGAAIINDVSALRDPDMAPLAAQTGAALVLMHMLGEPRTMQREPTYDNVVADIALYLRRAMARAIEAGVGPDRIIVDPGIGFGKTLAHNTQLIRRLPVLASLGCPILMGCSRKSMIQKALGLPVERRLNASLALNVLSIAGRASIIRVHDVAEACEAAAMTDAVLFDTHRISGED